MLRIVEGNIFSSGCQTLVNTVNCVGVMGAGIALEFKLRYPDMFEQYVEHCRNKEIDIGKLWLYKLRDHETPWVLNFPTKRDWKHPSKEEYLRKGLQRFVETYEREGIQSIAFPILGAQNGKIRERDAIGIMASYLYTCDIDIEIYRYDPAAHDDLYRKLEHKFHSATDAEIASETGLRVDRVAALRNGFDRPDIRTIGQLASTKGIGQKTLERVLSRFVEEKPSDEQLGFASFQQRSPERTETGSNLTENRCGGLATRF